MDYKAAGVLIYKKCNNKIFFLLGKENIIISNKKNNKSNKYCDFGGKRDIKDSTNIATASREFYEETMGSFYSLCKTKELLSKSNYYYNKKYKYYQFILEINISKDQIITYNNIRNYLNSCMKLISRNNQKFTEIPSCPNGYIEKQKIKWFELEYILNNTHIFRIEFINSLLKILNNNIIKIY